MKIENSLALFQTYLAVSEADLQSLSLESGLSKFLRFYRKERADGCNVEEDGDMLLFQWGISNYEGAEFFAVDFTRQFSTNADDDDNIWQLSLTFGFEETSETRTLKSGNEWCGSLDEIEEFEIFVRNSPAFRICASRAPDTVKLNYFCAG